MLERTLNGDFVQKLLDEAYYIVAKSGMSDDVRGKVSQAQTALINSVPKKRTEVVPNLFTLSPDVEATLDNELVDNLYNAVQHALVGAEA